VIIGEAIAESGPAIVISFVLAGVTCIFSALAYAELASTLPVSGSAYTYAYATMGEVLAWIIGWDLILEYGITISESISLPPGEGGDVNVPALLLVLAVAALLISGIRESALQHGHGDHEAARAAVLHRGRLLRLRRRPLLGLRSERLQRYRGRRRADLLRL
jgi:hypothetical protein